MGEIFHPKVITKFWLKGKRVEKSITYIFGGVKLCYWYVRRERVEGLKTQIFSVVYFMNGPLILELEESALKRNAVNWKKMRGVTSISWMTLNQIYFPEINLFLWNKKKLMKHTCPVWDHHLLHVSFSSHTVSCMQVKVNLKKNHLLKKKSDQK